jgi:iron(III) transport system ATP-binding protein
MAADLRLVEPRKEFTSPDGAKTVVAVDDVNLAIDKGKLVTLLGPSGCDKTTLLRMIAGFEEPTAGDIYFGERRVNNDAPNARDAAMVFQSYAIFPHLNVFDNVAFGLRLKRLPRHDIEARVERVLELTGLTDFQTRAPSQLSGGQQQRVALARCIVMEPRLLLFDEPLSNLDAKLREQMRVEIRELQQRLGITSVYVTHDQLEAMSISDLIVVMKDGVVQQVGPPQEIYARPASRFVTDFIGKANFIPARIAGRNGVVVAGATLPLASSTPLPDGSAVTLVVRPEAVRLSREGTIHGTVKRAMFLGSIAEYLVEVEGHGSWLVDVANPAQVGLYEAGERVALELSPDAVHLLRET